MSQMATIDDLYGSGATQGRNAPRFEAEQIRKKMHAAGHRRGRIPPSTVGASHRAEIVWTLRQIGEPMKFVANQARTDLVDFWRLSGALEGTRLPHTPFFAFLEIEGGVEMVVCDTITKLLELPDDTPVLRQWRGEWRSDVFTFSVGDARAAFDAREAERTP